MGHQRPEEVLAAAGSAVVDVNVVTELAVVDKGKSADNGVDDIRRLIM